MGDVLTWLCIVLAILALLPDGDTNRGSNVNPPAVGPRPPVPPPPKPKGNAAVPSSAAQRSNQMPKDSPSFKFELEQRVSINGTRAKGEIRGRAQYANGKSDMYSVEYVNGEGDLVDAWYEERQLTGDNEMPLRRSTDAHASGAIIR